MAVQLESQARRRWWVHEDWLAVWAGALVLFLIGAGAVPVMPALKWGGATAWSTPWTAAVILPWLAAGALLWAFAAIDVRARRSAMSVFTAGYAIVFALAWLSMWLAANAGASAWGLEYVVFALILGLIVGHTTGAPAWLLAAARTELFIKSGLVTMGATILFAEVLQAGVLGLVQAVAVVVVVWQAAFWLARRFRVDDELGVMLATAVSICGVSAAIAACGAINGDRRKLSHVTSMVLIVALPMIVLLPWLARAAAMPDVVAGAWLGGTLDTTGSVVAAAALVSETTMKVGTIVKFSQNVLIGVAAFALSVWWATRRHADRTGSAVSVIWERFPKFVLGFVLASIVFSFVLPGTLVAETKSTIGSIRTLWFALAFVSIGLETRLTDLLTLDEGRPLAAFVAAQGFNLVWTLVVAWLIFGGLLFPPFVL